MIRLEHLNLVVKDIPTTLAFYQAAFPHWYVRGGGDSDWYGTKRKWLHFGDEYQYLTFNDNGYGTMRDQKSNELGLSHFAFTVDNIDAVIRRLRHAGYEIYQDGANDNYRKNIYFQDPNGYEVEFVEYLSDIPQERNAYAS